MGRWLPIVALVAACRPAAAPSPPHDPPTERPDDPPATQTPPPPERPTPCGPVGEAFDAHAWAPETAPAVASIRLDDPELPAALQAVGAHARGSGHGLPIPLAFTLGQWSWQVPTLVATLGQVGLRPAELVFVASDEGDHAWVWRSTCDLDELVARMETEWSVHARRTVEGMVATPKPPAGPDDSAFPYDVLVLPGQRMALAPAGRATAVLERFAEPAPRMGLGVTPPPTAGRRLDALPPAAVRLSFVGRALLDPAAATAAHEARSLRVTANGVHPEPPDDASLPAPSP